MKLSIEEIKQIEVGNQIAFFNGFSAEFTGIVEEVCFDPDLKVYHFKVKNTKRTKKSDMNPHGMDINSFDEGRTVLASHILSVSIPELKKFKVTLTPSGGQGMKLSAVNQKIAESTDVVVVAAADRNDAIMKALNKHRAMGRRVRVFECDTKEELFFNATRI